jgi:hypothetical protein
MLIFLYKTDILNILKHINHSFQLCYANLFSEMTKKRTKCPRLYLLNDDDLLDVLCCGGNLEKVSQVIGKAFNNIDSLKLNCISANQQIVEGFYGRNKEYVPLKTVCFYGFIFFKPILFPPLIHDIFSADFVLGRS